MKYELYIVIQRILYVFVQYRLIHRGELMRIRMLNSKYEIETLKEGEEVVHLSFRPSNTDIMQIITRCKGLKALQLPSSYKKTLSDVAIKFLEMEDVELLEGDLKSTGISMYKEIDSEE